MKSEQSSDEIFGVPPQMKSNPPYPVSLRLGHARVLTTHRVAIHCARAASLPREAGFHREAISSTEGGFLPPTADLIEKNQVEIRLGFFLAGVQGFEPRDDGVRVRSLTAWRHPNSSRLRMIF